MALAKPARAETEDRFLDAAERLLVETGHAGITTRRLAEEAAANHGLVHYYFGSIENLFVRVLERFTGRLIERQRRMYSSDAPFIEKWRTAMRYMDRPTATTSGLVRAPGARLERPSSASGSPAWAREWRSVLRDALAEPLERY